MSIIFFDNKMDWLVEISFDILVQKNRYYKL